MSSSLEHKKQRTNKAVALTYRPESDSAPKVIAKGRGSVAERIIELARQHGIHIHDDPDLVEALAQLDLNAEIPTDLYIVVSELLAFIYGLNRQKGPDRE